MPKCALLLGFCSRDLRAMRGLRGRGFSGGLRCVRRGRTQLTGAREIIPQVVVLWCYDNALWFCIAFGWRPTDRNSSLGEEDLPRLSITGMRLEAGAAFDIRNALSDYLIEGISEGALVNEKTPFRY